jgi:hypothetical protein
VASFPDKNQKNREQGYAFEPHRKVFGPCHGNWFSVDRRGPDHSRPVVESSHGLWGYIIGALILFIGLVAYGIDLSDRFGLFKRSELEHITHHIFHNQVVEIDNKDFEDCTLKM